MWNDHGNWNHSRVSSCFINSIIIWGVVEAGAGSIQYAISSGAWLIITDEEIRGRAMALRGTIAQALRPIGILIVGPLETI